jgi:hypothetical protein
MEEKWIKYSSKSIYSEVYDIDRLTDINDKLSIYLLSEDRKITTIIFDGGVDSYRKSDETARVATISRICHNANDDFFFSQWPVYLVENSQYIHWLRKESCGIYDNISYKHYAIVTSNNLIEIVSRFEPLIIT